MQLSCQPAEALKGASKSISYVAIAQVAKKNRGKVSFVWLEGGSQPKLEETFNLGFGFPAVVLVNTKKSVYAVMRTAFSEDGLQNFVDGLFSGKQSVLPLPQDGLPPIENHAPWDGKDGVVEQAAGEADDDEFAEFLKEQQAKQAELDAAALSAEDDDL